MVGFAIFSIVVSYILLRYLPNPLDKLAKALAIIGIIIHELCHLLMAVVTNSKVQSYHLVEKEDQLKDIKGFEYSGWVKIDNKEKFTFLQAVFVALAPLYLSFWLFFFLLELLTFGNVSELTFFIVVLIMISIVLGASPSIADISSIPSAFTRNQTYSLYQIFLLVLSGMIVWLIITLNNINLPHEIFYYIFVLIGYYIFKFGFKGFFKLFQRHNKKMR